jgi:hypothetical protein
VFPVRYELNLYILWHVDPLLGGDREAENGTTAVLRSDPRTAREVLLEAVVCVWSVPRLNHTTDRVSVSSVE